jgi:hypothetical protein
VFLGHPVAPVAKMEYPFECPDNQAIHLRPLTEYELQAISNLLVVATLDSKMSRRLLGKQKKVLFEELGLSSELQDWLSYIHAKTIQEFAQRVLKQQTTANERLFSIE